jgi:hypothetical protein
MDDRYFSINQPAGREEKEVLAVLIRGDARSRLWRWRQREVENVFSFHSEAPLRDAEIVDRWDTASLALGTRRCFALYFQGEEGSRRLEI